MSASTLSRLSLLGLACLTVIGLGLALWLGLDSNLGFHLLQQHHALLVGFVASEPFLASVLFMAVYAVAVAASIPGLAVLTVAGGLLFGWLYGTIYTMVAATFAAGLVFVLARSALGAPLRARAGPVIKGFAEKFREGALSYVFILHLVPLLPYAMVITIPAACGVPLRVFLFSSFWGILPATMLLAYTGSGLGEVLARGGPIQLDSFMTPQILTSLVGLTLLALLPVCYRVLRRTP